MKTVVKNTGHQMFLRDHDSYDGTTVNRERLKELRSLAKSFWMLNDDTHGACTCAVCNLYPVSTKTNEVLVYITQNDQTVIVSWNIWAGEPDAF